MLNNPMKLLFQKFRVPKNRNDRNIYEFLQSQYNEYLIEIDNILYVNEKNSMLDQSFYDDLQINKNLIKELCDALLETISNYQQGYLIEALTIFTNKLNKIKPLFLLSNIRGIGIQNRFFRIRADKGDNRKDLFHIPFELNTKVKPYRFSLSGLPCLYLGAGQSVLPLCWFECGMPESFYWTEFQLDENVDSITLLDLTITPFTSAINAHRFSTSALINEPIKEHLLNCLTTYPLLLACSLTVDNKNNNFIPEYIIPQMLLSWIRTNTEIRGVAYKSSAKSEYVRNLNAFNIALPPVNITANGYCNILSQEFRLLMPKQITIDNIFMQFNSNFLKIQEFNQYLKQTYYTELSIDSIKTIISIFDSFIIIYKDITKNNSSNLQWIYKHLDVLVRMSYIIKLESYCKLMVSEANNIYNNKSKETLCMSIWEEFKNIQDNLLIFRNFDNYFGQDFDDFDFI